MSPTRIIIVVLLFVAMMVMAKLGFKYVIAEYSWWVWALIVAAIFAVGLWFDRRDRRT